MGRDLNPLLLLAFALATCSVCESKAQDRAESRPASPLAQVAEELRSEFGPVRFHRHEELEESFMVLGVPGSVLVSRPFIYEVQGERFDASRGVMTEGIPAALPTMYVATLRDESRIYRLTGFQGAERSFNDLVRDGPQQRMRTKQDVTSRGLLCAEIVYGLSPKWWLGGASSVKLKAAEHFFAEGHGNGLLLADKWWKSAKGNRDVLSTTTTASGGVFSVTVPVFWAPVEGSTVPEVRLYGIEVSETGTCRAAAPRTVLR